MALLTCGYRSGAKSCCQCCAGFFSDTERTLCNKCPTDRPYSAPGSNQNSDCTSTYNSGDPNPVSSCAMVANNVCPNSTSSGPIGTAISRKKRDLRCTQGYDACPRYSGRGGFDCVDTENDPESCGGCIGLDGQGTGTDCTTIKGASVTRCVKRACVTLAAKDGSGPSMALPASWFLAPTVHLTPPTFTFKISK
ncbi:hypothetical protein FRC00_002420 [Tulasnella sp. 408]|nr:hypothetical protein FRC00_002420 [Tulasnella sp. 408]